MKLIITGLIANYPLGGVTWDYLQYVLGFQKLGLEVYYLEDTGRWNYNPTLFTFTEECDYNVTYLKNVMEHFGLEGRWCFRNVDGKYYGLTEEKLKDLCRRADSFINISGSCVFRPEYRECQKKVYIDSDPGYNQFKVAKVFLKEASGYEEYCVARLAEHDFHFTFAENIGLSECKLPTHMFQWLPTRQPIVLDLWEPNFDGDCKAFTTVMSWRAYDKPLEFNGELFLEKDVELERFIHLPLLTDQWMELAISGGAPRERLKRFGWKVVDGHRISTDMKVYQDYIARSKAEFSICKNAYVKTKSGWFSCRSACYLATGKPVLLQDTGFSHLYPIGNGLFTFSSIDDILKGIHEIGRNYKSHCLAARELAETYFNSDLVLEELLRKVYEKDYHSSWLYS